MKFTLIYKLLKKIISNRSRTWDFQQKR